MKTTRTAQERAARKQTRLARAAQKRAEESARGKALAADRRAHPAKYKASPTRVEWEGHQLVTRQKGDGKWLTVSVV